MNLSTQLISKLSKIQFIVAGLKKHASSVTNFVKNSQVVQLAQFMVQNNKVQKQTAQVFSAAIQAAYTDQIQPLMVQQSTEQQLRTSITLANQFSKLVSGTQKWQSWKKACSDQLQTRKNQSSQPKTQTTGCLDCSAKIAIKVFNKQYSPLCSNCQKLIRLRWDILGAFIKSKYILDQNGSTAVKTQSFQSKYGESPQTAQLQKRFERIFEDKLNWQYMTSIYTLFLTPFREADNKKQVYTPPSACWQKGMYGADLYFNISSYPSGSSDTKVMYTLAYEKGRWVWRSQISSNKGKQQVAEYQFSTALKDLFIYVLKDVKLTAMKTVSLNPGASIMKPQRRND